MLLGFLLMICAERMLVILRLDRCRQHTWQGLAEDYIDKGHRNRLLTVFWYLTNVAKGGETAFPRANALPQPEDAK